jgi:hypothetical protein
MSEMPPEYGLECASGMLSPEMYTPDILLGDKLGTAAEGMFSGCCPAPMLDVV